MTLSTFIKPQWPARFPGRSIGLSLAFWLLGQLALAQPIISTAAGGNGLGASANAFYTPNGIYLDSSGNLYVADAGNHRVQKFPPNSTSSTAGITVAGGNGEGSAANQLYNPSDVYVDGSGYLYVVDTNNRRIQKFPPNSTSATSATTVAGGNGNGSGPTQLSLPSDVFVDGSGNLYVADNYNHRIQKFPPNSTSATSATTVAGGNNIGAGPTQMGYPGGVLVDGSGYLYVLDSYNNRVQKFPPNSTSASSASTVAGGNGIGGGPTQFYNPSGLFMDDAGNLYVTDLNNSRVQQFPPNSTQSTAGTTVAGGNGQGSAQNQLYSPKDVFVDRSGTLYVSEQQNYRVQKYRYPPVISSQPVDVAVCSGGKITAQVSATTTLSDFSYTYQWYAGDAPLNGQTSAILSLSNVSSTQQGTYYAVITSANGLSAKSDVLKASVLASPTASLVASGSLSAATPSVTLTASGGDLYQFGPGATQIGSGPTATVSAPGLYYVKVIGSSGCSDVASVTVSQALAPDLTPSLYARPTSVNANTPVSIVVDITELNGVATRGSITLKVTQQAGLNLTLPRSATVGGRPVNNSAWILSGPSGGYYTLTSVQSISGGGMLSVGLTGTFSGSGSTGGFTISGTLTGTSGGDGDPSNNTDADRLEYFQQ